MAAFQLRRHWPRGSPLVADELLRLNLSLVLHDHSESQTVRMMAESCHRHAANIARLPARVLLSAATVAGHPVELGRSILESSDPCDYVVSPFIGIPQALEQKLAQSGLEAPMLFCDHSDYLQTRTTFFRAPARLALPPQTDLNLRVACLVLRPGGHDAQLRISDHFRWPEEQLAVLRELEQVVLSYCDQWLPGNILWNAPAESLLPNEIVHPPAAGFGRSAASTI